MKVQPADVHHMRRLLESFLNVAVLESSVPIAIRAHLRMNKALVLQRFFSGQNRRQRLVFDFHQFGSVFRNQPGFRHNSGDRFSLIHHFIYRHRIVCDFLPDIRSDFNEWLHHRFHFGASQRADHAR